ncbi:MAG: ATP-binding protein [Sulfuricellaceae bacterium]
MNHIAQLLRNTSFSRQISIVVAMAVLSIAFTSSLAISWQGSRQIRANLLEQGRQVSENLARQSRLALIYDAPDNANEAAMVTLSFPDVIALEIRHTDGGLLLARNTEHNALPPKTETPVPLQRLAYVEAESDDTWRFVAPVLAGAATESPFDVAEPQQEMLGYVRVTQSKATLERMRTELFAVNFAVSFFFAFVFLLIGRNLTARLTQPLDQLSAAMARAEAGSGIVRAVPSGPKDIVVMALAFNKMMAMLEERERYLQTLLDNLPAAVVVYGPDAAIRYANPVARNFFGQPEARIPDGTAFDASWHFVRADGSLMPREEYPVNQVIKDRRPLHDYTIGIVRSAEEVPLWASVSAFPEIDAGNGAGGSLEQVIVCLVDITERKQYELAVEHEAQEWTQAMDSFADVIYLLDMQLNMVRANKAFFALTGNDPKQAIGRPISELMHAPLPEELCPVRRAQKEKRDAVIVMEADHPANITHCPIEVIVKVIRDQAGEPHHLLTSIRDLTSVRKYEAELRRLNESLEQRVRLEVGKNREKDAMLIQQSRLATMGEMMHNVAHQWRQPLTAMTLILYNIKDDFDFGELNKESLYTQVAQGVRLSEKMSSTIDDFRKFFRPDKAVSRFNLGDSVRQALNLVEANFSNNQIEVEVEAAENVQVEGYANEYSQVLLNVLGNAKDAFGKKKTGGKVTIIVGRDDGLGVVRIRDNGGGIPEEILPKIFDPYFTTKESGTGIGLYMSRMIMSHMHGNITAHNADSGAEFVISVPVCQMAEDRGQADFLIVPRSASLPLS